MRARAAPLGLLFAMLVSAAGGRAQAADAAYEAILIAINDQPVSFRVAASAYLRDDTRQVVAGLPASRVLAWTGTAGIRMAFFSPPVPQALRK